MAARLTGATWTTETVQTGITPSGLSVAVDANGTPWVTYYTGDGAVNLATTSGAAWTTAKVADAKPGDGTGNLAETTACRGRRTTAPSTSPGTTLADTTRAPGERRDGSSFKPIDTTGTEGGAFPSLAVTPDGSRVFLAWYDVERPEPPGRGPR